MIIRAAGGRPNRTGEATPAGHADGPTSVCRTCPHRHSTRRTVTVLVQAQRIGGSAREPRRARLGSTSLIPRGASSLGGVKVPNTPPVKLMVCDNWPRGPAGPLPSGPWTAAAVDRISCDKSACEQQGGSEAVNVPVTVIGTAGWRPGHRGVRPGAAETGQMPLKPDGSGPLGPVQRPASLADSPAHRTRCRREGADADVQPRELAGNE